MNGRVAKKIRRELKKKQTETESKIALSFKKWVNLLPLKDRFRIGYRIMLGRF